MHGYGEWTHPSGEGYRGEYEQNKPHGCGTHTAASGEVYLGEWSRGLRQGKGVVTNHEAESNSKSVGSFHAGTKHGPMVRYAPGEGVPVLEQWNCGRLQTAAEASWVDQLESEKTQQELGKRYEGVSQQLRGAVEPKGTEEGSEEPTALETHHCVFPTGASYRGEIWKGKKHGHGYWVHPQGECYEGEFMDGHFHGFGVYHWTSSGRTYMGWWENGKRHGWGLTFLYATAQEISLGQYENDSRHGYGVYIVNGKGVMHHWKKGNVTKEEDKFCDQADITRAMNLFQGLSVSLNQIEFPVAQKRAIGGQIFGNA